MTGYKPWRHSESRPIRPFKVSEGALKNIGFKISPDASYSHDEPWSTVVEPHDLAPPSFAPSFDLRIDIELLTNDAGINADDLKLFIVVRDPGAWRSSSIVAWPVIDLPSNYIVPDDQIAALPGTRGLQFNVQVAPASELVTGYGSASKPGQIVASKSFELHVPGEGVDFPIQLVSPSYLESINLPRKTVWVIDWRTQDDFDQPAGDILQVLINEEEGERLVRLSSRDSVAAVLWREVATEIFVEIAAKMFGEQPPMPEKSDSLLAKMYERLRQASDKDFDEIVQAVNDPYTGVRFLRAYLQTGMDLGGKIQQMNLAGRAQ